MTNLPIINQSNEKYPGEMPDILSHRASVVSNGIHRILEAVPVAEETQVFDSGMTVDQKRAKLLNTKPFSAESPTMPQDVYITALASETSSETSTPLNGTNADLLGTAQAALRDIFGTRSGE
jgi:hypothetical protein